MSCNGGSKGEQKMGNILAFGDSNTWGLIPGSFPYRRYSEKVRWTGVLQKKVRNMRVLEEGLCGRTTVFEDKYRSGRKGINTLKKILAGKSSFNSVVLMLGTNDCKKDYAASPTDIGRGIEECIDQLEEYVSPEKVLLVSPIYLGDEVWRPEKDPEFDLASVNTSRQLKGVYEEIAKRRGVNFLAASDYVSADEKDDEHLNEEGHRIFADVIYDKLREMKVV